MVQEEDADLAAGLEAFLTLAPAPLRRALAENTALLQVGVAPRGVELKARPVGALITTPRSRLFLSMRRTSQPGSRGKTSSARRWTRWWLLKAADGGPASATC